MKRYLYTFLLMAAIIAADAVTKHLIVEYFQDVYRLDYLGGLLRLSLVYNQGGVFGILQGQKTFFLIVSIVVLALMIGYYFFEKQKSWLFCNSMGLIMGGAVGNIMDRLIPDRPGVVDFISVGVDGLYRWPSFNVADSSIVVGAFLLAVLFFREEKKRKEQQQAEAGRNLDQ